MQPTLGPHMSEDTLEQYTLGGLPELETAALEEHLLVCSTCQARLEETESFTRAIRSAARKLRAEPAPGGEEVKGKLSHWMAMPRPIWAAGAVAALVLVFLAMRPGGFLRATNMPPLTIALHSARGAEGLTEARARASKPLVLTIELQELPAHPSYRLEIVDSGGDRVREYTAVPAQGVLSVGVREKLKPGRYWVRLYGPAGQPGLLREYGLQAE